MKQPIRILMISIALIWTTASYAASTNTYKWVDEQGNVHYSQRPPPGSNYEKMKVKTPAGSPGAAQQSTAETPSAQNSNTKKGGADVLSNELAKNQEIRAQNCEAAKKNLQAYTVYRRIRAPDGSVKRLDDNERAKLIEETKASIKEFCN